MKKLFPLCISLLFTAKLLAQQKPNIVIIISDDHAYQSISAYGSKLTSTPNIDRIAREGVLFKKAYCTNSICGPSRAVLLTGKLSHKNGFKDNENSSFDGSQNSFAKELRKAGYQTSWIGKWHLQTTPQGFDFWQILPGQGSYYNPDFLSMDGTLKRITGYVTDITENIAEDWLSNRDTDKPFCMVIGFNAAHRTWMPDTADLGAFDKINFPLPKNFYDNYKGREAAQIQDMTIAKTMRMDYDLKMFDKDDDKNKMAGIQRMNSAQRVKFDAYYDSIKNDLDKRQLSGDALTEWKYQRYLRDYLSTARSLDRNIGRTLDYLDKNGLAKNTIVIYLSDQGFYLGEHGWFDKRWMYEESFRTPMMMRYPGVIKAGQKSEDMVLNLDVAPTILEAAGVSIPPDMQGLPILPLLAKKTKPRDAIYYHYYEDGEHSVSPHFGIRTHRYKLIRFYKKVNQWELFDLQNDPNEMKNIYGAGQYRDVIARLKTQLKKLVTDYEDDEAMRILNEPL